MIPAKHGAYAVRGPVDDLDLHYWKRVTERVHAVAVHQDFGGEDFDEVEVSRIVGRYDWRAYLREELNLRTRAPLELLADDGDEEVDG